MKQIKILLLITLISSLNLNAQFNLTVETYSLNNFPNLFATGSYSGAVDIKPKASTIVESDQDGQDKVVSFYYVKNEGIWLTVVGSGGNVIASKLIKADRLASNYISGNVKQELIVNAATNHPEEKDLVVFTGQLVNPSNANKSVMFIANIDLSTFAIQSTVIDVPANSGITQIEGVQVKHLSNFDYIVIGRSIAGSKKNTAITKYNAGTNVSSTKVIKNIDFIPNDFEFSNVNPGSIVIAGYTLKRGAGMFEVCGNILGSQTLSSDQVFITFLEYDYNADFINLVKDYKTEELYTSLNLGAAAVAKRIYSNGLKIIKNHESYMVLSKNIDHIGLSGVGYESVLLQLDNGYDLLGSRSFYNNSNGIWDHEGRIAKISDGQFAISINYTGQGVTGLSYRGSIVTTSTFSNPFSAVDVLFRYDVNPINLGNSNTINVLGEYKSSSLIANSNHIYSSVSTYYSNFSNPNQNIAYVFSYDPSYLFDRDVCELQTTMTYASACVEGVDIERSAQIVSAGNSDIRLVVSDINYTPYYCNPDNAESDSQRLKVGENKSEESGLNPHIKMEVYPNPNNGLFSLDLYTNKSKIITLQVKNVVGQTVYSELINLDSSSKKQLDLTKFGKGVYSIFLESESGNVMQKVIVK